jgi:uncharacterized membrane protein YadS
VLDLLHRHPRSARRARLGAVAAGVAALVGTLASCAATVPDRLNLPFGDAQQLIVVILLFAIGLETDIGQLIKVGGTSLTVAFDVG